MDVTKKTMARDTLIYIPAKIAEGIIGIVTLSVYAILFSVEVVGLNGLITPTINLAAGVLTGWIAQSTYRYVNEYKDKNKLNELLSTSGVMILFINLVTLIVSQAIIYFVVPSSEKVIYMLAAFWFVAFSISQACTSLLGALRKIKLNLILSVSAVSFKLLLTVLFVKVFNDLRAVFISNILVDGIVSIIAIKKLELYKYIKLKYFSKEELKKYWSYGIPIAIMGFTVWLLNLSDRYIIGFIFSKSEVGIYNLNYSIASAAFTMIMFGVMRGVYPSLLKEWKGNNKERVEELLSHGVRYYIMIALPAAVGLAMLSLQISKTLFTEPYWQSSSVIAWVSMGMFLYGLAEYSNKAWELTGKTKIILFNVIMAAIFSIALNLIFIKPFGYNIAAVVTFISYLFYFSVAFFRGRKILRWNLSSSFMLKLTLSITSMIIFLYLSSLINGGKIFLVVQIIGAVFIYFGVMAATGELKEELSILKKRRK